jgi:mRNA interferase YafQ
MKTINRTHQFKKDFKLAIKRGLDISLLEEVMERLFLDKPLAGKHRDHALTGDYKSYRECHILPDWLLIYQNTKDLLIVDRLGTHADLFG